MKKVFNYTNQIEQTKVTSEVLNGREITNENKTEIMYDILKLDFVNQLNVIINILDTMYKYSSNDTAENNIICDFLSNPCFNIHRDILYTCASDENEQEIKKLEKTHNIEINLD